MQRQPQSIFPDLPRERPAVDKDGNFTGIWSLGLAYLFQALQYNFSNEGIKFPALGAADIATIQSLYTSYIGGTYGDLTFALPDISGKTVFDSDNLVSKQFVIATDTLPPANNKTVILAEWVPFSVTKQGIGSPNGFQAGIVGWQYYDTVGMVLYICTVAGNASTAVWSLV